MKESPTQEIIKLARQAPGGLIRWYEARDAYLEASAAARANERSASRTVEMLRRRGNVVRSNGYRQYHMSLQQVLRRHFRKVSGTDSFYVLKEKLNPEEPDGDDIDLILDMLGAA